MSQIKSITREKLIKIRINRMKTKLSFSNSVRPLIKITPINITLFFSNIHNNGKNITS